MKRILDEVLRRSNQLDAVVDGLVARKLAGGRVQTPAELMSTLLADLEARMTIGPDGSLFPYNRVAITLNAADEARRSELRAALPAAAVIASVKEHLERRGQLPPDLRVDVVVATGPAPSGAAYELTVRTVASRIAAMQSGQTTGAWLIAGSGGRRYSLAEGVYNIGRVDEARGRNGQLFRQNQIVVDGGAGRTVSRTHAHIEGTRTASDLVFLLFDDSPRDGATTVIRAGRTHKVHRGTFGFRLKDGDELCLGQARLEFKLRPARD